MDTLINTREATTDEELTVYLMADALYVRSAELKVRTSVVSTLRAAGFREDRIEKHGYAAAMTAWYHYGGSGDEWPVGGWGEVL